MATSIGKLAQHNFKKFVSPKLLNQELRAGYKRFTQIYEPELNEPPSLAEIKLEWKKEDPVTGQVIDIGLPWSKDIVNLREIRQKTTQLKKDKNLEKLARLRKLQIPLDEVEKDWLSEVGASHCKRIAEHYGIYKDLFGSAYFLPRIQLSVSYPFDDETSNPVLRGNKIPPSEASTAPDIKFEAEENSFWTLVLTCPDEHLENQDKEYLHWMVANIKNDDVSSGDLLCKYLPPIPPNGTGYHRYIFILYKQEGVVDYSFKKIDENRALDDRTFNTYDFYAKYQDQITPAGLAFFQSEWDSTVRDTFRITLGMPEPSYEYDFPHEYHPEQEFAPIKQPFNFYLDRYRDRKLINEQVIKEKMKMISPFEDHPKRLKYPNIFSMIDKPSWLREEIKLKNFRKGKWKELP